MQFCVIMECSRIQTQAVISNFDSQGVFMNQNLNDELSEIELRIVSLVSDGKTNREIAEELNYSIDTVKTYLKHIFKKLNAKSRAHVAAKYLLNNPDHTEIPEEE